MVQILRETVDNLSVFSIVVAVFCRLPKDDYIHTSTTPLIQLLLYINSIFIFCNEHCGGFLDNRLEPAKNGLIVWQFYDSGCMLNSGQRRAG